MSMQKIPLCRPVIDDHEVQAVLEVLKSGWLTHGPKNKEFEEAFAEYIGVRNAVSMNSCSSALFLALLANNIKGEVLVPSFTFVATANAIVTAGATPVFVDINYHDCNINPDLLQQHLTDQTQALMVVHYGGQCCEMERISEFVRRNNLILIEDSAETIGGTFKGLPSGSWGVGCFSFFPTKNITTGEGGMLTTNDDSLAAKVRAYIAHGIEKSTLQRTAEQRNWYRAATIPGYNFRLSNLLAAIGVEQMKKLDEMNEARREKSFYLIERLQEIEELDVPNENEDCHHVYQMMTAKVKKGNRDEFVLALRERGIEASVHFDPPVHQHPAYARYKCDPLSVTERVARSIVTLPMYPRLSRSELDAIVAAVKDFFTHV